MAIIENKKLNFIYLPMIVIVRIIFIDIKKQYNRRYTPKIVVDGNGCYRQKRFLTENKQINWSCYSKSARNYCYR